jgi:hypothetical protein
MASKGRRKARRARDEPTQAHRDALETILRRLDVRQAAPDPVFGRVTAPPWLRRLPRDVALAIKSAMGLAWTVRWQLGAAALFQRASEARRLGLQELEVRVAQEADTLTHPQARVSRSLLDHADSLRIALEREDAAAAAVASWKLASASVELRLLLGPLREAVAGRVSRESGKLAGGSGGEAKGRRYRTRDEALRRQAAAEWARSPDLRAVEVARRLADREPLGRQPGRIARIIAPANPRRRAT